MPVVNAPAVVAEISALHDAYERALAASDVPALNAFFWDSPHTVRYGLNEHLCGGEGLAEFQQGAPPASPQRTLVRRTILALGDDAASVMCELSQTSLGQTWHGRQSQVWVRFPVVGWKIVSAHVSNILSMPDEVAAWHNYVDHAAVALELPLDRAHRSGVVLSLQRTAAIAAPLLAFPLPADRELAPQFTP